MAILTTLVIQCYCITRVLNKKKNNADRFLDCNFMWDTSSKQKQNQIHLQVIYGLLSGSLSAQSKGARPRRGTCHVPNKLKARPRSDCNLISAPTTLQRYTRVAFRIRIFDTVAQSFATKNEHLFYLLRVS